MKDIWYKTWCIILGIWSCNAFVNLTWTAEKDMLTLKCKTRPLIWSVQFLSPAGKEIAYCQIPFPSPRCYTTDESYITVNQDTSTNTTILTYKGISSSLNGQWKCIHGNNVDLDVVNVTIRVKGMYMYNLLSFVMYIAYRFQKSIDWFINFLFRGCQCVMAEEARVPRGNNRPSKGKPAIHVNQSFRRMHFYVEKHFD